MRSNLQETGIRTAAGQILRIRWWLLGWLLMAMLACKKDTPEQAIRGQISAMEAALEERKLDDFMARVSKDFRSGREGMDRRALRLFLQFRVLNQNDKFDATLGPVDVKINGERATASFDVLGVGGANWIPERAEHWRVETVWVETDGEWLLAHADWE